MDSKEFRIRGKEMIDYVADYLDSIEKRPVLPQIKPGYLRELIPDQAPEESETWNDLMKDIERVILAKHAKPTPLMKSAGAVSAKPDLKSMQKKDLGLPKINPISHRNTTVKSV